MLKGALDGRPGVDGGSGCCEFEIGIGIGIGLIDVNA
jgi:hypothetical protein